MASLPDAACPETVKHPIDRDCPTCEMMADGIFGTCFTGIDGHHLDLDDEFAFSMHETREDWESQQREFAEMSATIDRERANPEAAGETVGYIAPNDHGTCASNSPMPATRPNWKP